MAKPKCEKCSWHPKMKVYKRGEVFEIKKGAASATSKGMKRWGHPDIALAIEIFGGVADITNIFVQKIKYKCKVCGAQTSRYKLKK